MHATAERKLVTKTDERIPHGRLGGPKTRVPAGEQRHGERGMVFRISNFELRICLFADFLLKFYRLG
jgi:hypothetical protein